MPPSGGPADQPRAVRPGRRLEMDDLRAEHGQHVAASGPAQNAVMSSTRRPWKGRPAGRTGWSAATTGRRHGAIVHRVLPEARGRLGRPQAAAVIR